jgi:DNA-binding SARP family transcriptional activator
MVLGPVSVERDGAPVRLGPQQTGLLCALLAAGGRLVPVTRLVELLWAAPPPAAAVATLRSHVSHLRHALEPGRSGRDSILVSSGAGPTAGYRLDLAVECVDAYRFERAMAQGERMVADDPAQAAAILEGALRLWRGPAYADVADRPFAIAEIARLNALRHAAHRAFAEALFALDRHAEVIDALTGVVAEAPYDEGLRKSLALALYHGRRVVEAAAVCREGLTLLHERGHDAPELQDLQRMILRRAVPVAPVARQAPCLLPPPPARLVGRAAELAEAVRQLAGTRDRPVTLLVSGPAGVGKTIFAVQAGHQLAADFPDGQLFAELQDGSGEPVPASAVLDGFLRALGVRGNAIPTTEEERLRLYRSLVARRRVLVVLDNAVNPAQVRDLLPNGCGCAAVVTSQTRLAGLDGVRMPLSVLSTEQALTLLGEMVGQQRIAAQPEAAQDIVRWCGGLPLAVWVASARLAARPHLRLADLARAFADEHHRLDELVVGDVAVRASVELTYRGLGPDTRRAVRRLGLLNSPVFPGWALAALLDTTLAQADRVLDDLVEVHLAEPDAAGQYRLHDLVRLFARERAGAEEGADSRASAVRRLAGLCLDLTETADARLGADFLGPARRRLPRWALPQADADWLTGDPRTWFDRQHDFLVSMVDQAGQAGEVELASALAGTLTTFFQLANRFTEWRQVQSRALRAAVAAGDRAGALVLRRGLGELDTIQDRYAEAAAHFEAALDQPDSEPDYRAALLAGLGHLHRLLAQYGQALAYFRRSRHLAEQTGNVNGLVYAECGIGVVNLECGQLAAAEQSFTASLSRSRQAGYQPGAAQALRCLGYVARARGAYAEAARLLQSAMDISVALDDRLSGTHAACWLGEVKVRLGEHAAGRQLLARCLCTYREYGNAWGEAAALQAISTAHLAAGRPVLARARAEQAVAIWRRLGTPYWLSRGLAVLADALQALGDPAAAEHRRAATAWRAAPDGVLGMA